MNSPENPNPFRSPETTGHDIPTRAVLRLTRLSWILPTLGSISYLLLMFVALLGLQSPVIVVLLITMFLSIPGGLIFTIYATLKRKSVPDAWPQAQWGIMANFVLWLLIFTGCMGLMVVRA